METGTRSAPRIQNGSTPIPGPDPASRTSADLSESSKDQPRTLRQTLFSWRVAITLHMHTQIVLFMMIRQDMPFAFVCMLGNSSRNESMVQREVASQTENVTSFEEDLQTLNENASDFYEGRRGEFDWDSSLRGFLLTSTNILGFVLPLMTDLVIRKVGGKRLLFWGMLTAGVLTLLEPLGARLSPYVLMGLRLAIGFIAGMGVPVLNEVFSWWAPRSELVTLVSFALAGINIANVLVSLTGGYLCSIPFDNGWPFIFYVHGALCILWSFAWQFTGSVKPEDHPFISEDEKQYIARTRKQAMDKSQKRPSPPYKKILTTVPVWGLLIMTSVHHYSMQTLMAYIPIYLNTVLQYTTQQVGLISSIGYGGRFLAVIIWGQISNLLLRKTHLQTTAVRKVIQGTGYILGVAGLVGLGFLKEQVSSTVLVFAVMVFMSCTPASVMIIPLDLAPRFAGFLSGLNMTMACIVCMPGPVIASAMLQQGTREEWRNVFLTVAGMGAVGVSCFLLMASSQLQSWAVQQDSDHGKGNQNSAVRFSDRMVREMIIVAEEAPSSPSAKQRRLSFMKGVQPSPPIKAGLQHDGPVLDGSSSSPASGARHDTGTSDLKTRSTLRPKNDNSVLFHISNHTIVVNGHPEDKTVTSNSDVTCATSIHTPPLLQRSATEPCSSTVRDEADVTYINLGFEPESEMTFDTKL